jgi:hypothetical protein
MKQVVASPTGVCILHELFIYLVPSDLGMSGIWFTVIDSLISSFLMSSNKFSNSLILSFV